MKKIGQFIYPWGNGHYSRMMRLDEKLSKYLKAEYARAEQDYLKRLSGPATEEEIARVRGALSRYEYDRQRELERRRALGV